MKNRRNKKIYETKWKKDQTKITLFTTQGSEDAERLSRLVRLELPFEQGGRGSQAVASPLSFRNTSEKVHSKDFKSSTQLRIRVSNLIEVILISGY